MLTSDFKSMPGKIIKIDGAKLNGGGQMLRTALAMSIVKNKPFEMTNIRHKRPNSGIKKQHLSAIEILKKLSNSKTENAFLGSKSIKFFPGEFKGGSINFDIETAGSITLVMQAIMLPMIFLKPTRVKITGGTDVLWAPTADYFKNVLSFYYRKYCELDVKILKRGYYPKGKGVISVKTKPYNIKTPKPLSLTKQYNDFTIVGISHASKDLMNKEVAERQASSANEILKRGLHKEANIDILYSETESTGSGICLWAAFNDFQRETAYVLGTDKLGGKKISAENVGKDAALRLIEEIKSGVVDKLLADQLIPLLAIVGGEIKTSEITEHTETNIFVVNKFLDKQEIVFDKKTGIIKRINKS